MEDKVKIRYGSVCSGVEAASLAWKDLGWECTFVSEVEPFPCAVLQQRFDATPPINPLDPNEEDLDDKERKQRKTWLNQIKKLPQTGTLPNEGDFTKIGKKYEGKIDLLVGGTPCFAAGTMVLTPKGYVPIESLNVGDDIISGSGKIQKVEAIGSKIAEVGDFHVLGRPIISCTPNHQWFAIEMKRDNIRTSETYAHKIPVGDYRKVVASEVKGQYIGRIKVSPIEQPEIPKVNNATERDIIELAGWYVGDGYTYHSKTKNSSAVVFTLCDAKKIEIFQSTFKDKINFSLARDGRITIYSEIFANWLEEHFGRLSLNKRIPYWLYSSSYKEDFLKGYFITDGCENEHLYRYTTTSKALAYGVADLLEDACVCFTKVAPTTIIQGRTVNQHDYYNIHKYKNKTIRTKHIKDRFASVAKGFKNVGTARVFNITVSEEHSYIAEGLWSANCQDLSIAGKRLGFEGKRSSLALDFIRLAYESRTKWIVWENVPGALSANNGRDFSTFLSGLTGLEIETPPKGWKNAGFIPNARKDRYGVAWRILDAQYTRTPNFPHAVPQRRRRIFLVGYFGDWKRAAQVLFESESLSGYLEPSRKAREEIARDVAQCSNKSNGGCTFGGNNGRGCCYQKGNDCYQKGNKSGNIILNNEPLYCVDEGAGKSSCCVSEGLSPTLTTAHGGSPVIREKQECYNITTCDANGTRKDRPNGGMYVNEAEASKTLSTNNPNTETVIVNETKCFQQNVREEVRFINGDGKIAGTVSAETGTHQQNYIAEQQVYTKEAHPQNSTEPQGYKEADVAKTLNLFNVTETRAEEIVVEKKTYSIDRYNQSIEEEVANTVKLPNGGDNINTIMSYGADQYNLEITNDVTSTLGVNCGMSHGRQSVVEVYSLDSKSSNSMKSSNPNSGCHKTEVAKTIDTSVPEPSKNQGGIAIVEIEKDEGLLF